MERGRVVIRYGVLGDGTDLREAVARVGRTATRQSSRRTIHRSLVKSARTLASATAAYRGVRMYL